MARSRPTESAEPLYVRWTPSTCPYALEMRLDLVAQLKSDLAGSEATGIEIGGVFFGVLPTQDSPTLRLDDLISVPSSTKEFSLDASQVKHLAEMSAEARLAGRSFAGFFRSHLRPRAMVPTPADAAMLSPQFPEGIFAFLLIGSPRQGAFFLAIGGQLPVTPSAPPFKLEESTFQSLPELPAEATEDVRNFNFARVAPSRSVPWPAILSFALVLFLIATWTLGSRISAFFRPDSNQIDLTVIKAGGNLKITWDHSSPVLAKALGATLTINDGTTHRELKLDLDDLNLGQVSYERLSKKVYVIMSLDIPGTSLPPQTFDWTTD